MDGLIILSGLISFFLFLAVLAMLFRVTRQEAAIESIFRAFFGVGIAAGAMFLWIFGAAQILFWASFYGLLALLFVQGIFSIMEASLTLRIFTQIARAKHGIPMTLLMDTCNTPLIVKRRITRLLYSGELKKSRGMYMRGRTSYFALREVLLDVERFLFP